MKISWCADVCGGLREEISEDTRQWFTYKPYKPDHFPMWKAFNLTADINLVETIWPLVTMWILF